ncbi:unnamed protein product [Notodromas monacha]|uniref:Protein AAR2 homolog n=1 Tax=Notodromas monacha TaxID=399045 RepID=A0A7R9G9F2_9CRUS|nr:unnamed protein product [Notodromas monacha]CAG0912816.1 unnamed protein product [Notodromas monacha]
MDPDIAKRLFDEGGTFVLLDVPVGTEFGIDMNTWNVGDKFRGVKMIPPGLHFIYYSAVSKEGSTAPRTGFFHWFEKEEVLARFYSAKDEEITDRRATEDELERFKANKKEMDTFLGVYPYESWKQWVSITNHISKKLLERIQPLCVTIASASNLVRREEQEENIVGEPSERKRHKGSGSATREEDLMSHLICAPGTEIRWSQILGELQFAFVCFLVAHVYDSFERWKRLIDVICRSEKALHDHPGFFMDFMTVLHFQIKLVPQDFFADIVSNNNFLIDALRKFFPNVEEEGSDALVKRAKKFKEHLQDKFEWDFEEENEDDQPVVVDL